MGAQFEFERAPENMSSLAVLVVSVVAVAANPYVYLPSGLNGYNGYSGIAGGYNYGRSMYAMPAATLPAPVTPTKTGIDTVSTDASSAFPNIPGLDDTQKELINMIVTLKPEITAQLARIGANIGPWAALNGAGTSVDLARLPPVINEQMASIAASGDRLLTIMQRMLAEIWPEVDNLAATSNKLLEEISPSLQYVPAKDKKSILELTDATKKIATLLQKNNPKLKALANQSLATQKAQLAVVAGKIHGAQEIQANTRFGV